MIESACHLLRRMSLRWALSGRAEMLTASPLLRDKRARFAHSALFR